MGSRVMHLIIANQIANKVPIADKKAFLLGGIAPDAVSPKESSHYFTGDVSDYSRSIEFDRFIEKYKSHQHSSYILGYYTHLIADDLWLKGFYLPWLKNRMEKDLNIFSHYHHDFRMLNGKLLDYYCLKEEDFAGIDKCELMIELDEVSVKDVQTFIPYLLKDMEYEQKDLDEPLNVFTFQQIVGYIETSIDKGIIHLNQLL